MVWYARTCTELWKGKTVFRKIDKIRKSLLTNVSCTAYSLEMKTIDVQDQNCPGGSCNEVEQNLWILQLPPMELTFVGSPDFGETAAEGARLPIQAGLVAWNLFWHSAH